MVRKVGSLARQPHKAKGTKKGRKYGRNLKKCMRYKLEGRHEKSHRRRILKHIKKYKDTSVMVVKALEKYGTRKVT